LETVEVLLSSLTSLSSHTPILREWFSPGVVGDNAGSCTVVTRRRRCRH
jgi:hypothetical protein